MAASFTQIAAGHHLRPGPDAARARARADIRGRTALDGGGHLRRPGVHAFEQLAEGELRDRLIDAIAALPEREAMVIQLYYVEELNLEEIGEVLGVGAARVCQIKAAAHGRLKKTMTRLG